MEKALEKRLGDFLNDEKIKVLTHIYHSEFTDEYKQTNMIGGHPKPVVLNYSKRKARIYYVDSSGGNVISFIKRDNKWIMESWDETVWSKTGSADGFIWPLIR